MYYHHLQDMEAHPAFSPKNLRGPPQMQRFPPRNQGLIRGLWTTIVLIEALFPWGKHGSGGARVPVDTPKKEKASISDIYIYISPFCHIHFKTAKQPREGWSFNKRHLNSMVVEMVPLSSVGSVAYNPPEGILRVPQLPPPLGTPPLKNPINGSTLVVFG